MEVLRSSRVPGFYRLSVDERLQKVGEFAGLISEEMDTLRLQGLPVEVADKMIENVVGTFELPLGIAVNFLINGKPYLIPMAIEEPSVVAAASFAAKLALQGGGFFTNSTESVMIGQIQVTNVPNPFGAKVDILASKEEIIRIANDQDPLLVSFGGGARDVEVRVLDDTLKGPMVIVHLLVDTKDAMGANATNTMCEAVAHVIERITGGRVYLRILSNLAVRRLARARVVIPKEALAFSEFSGEEVIEGILEAYAFAAADPYRAATHNKGIMNGIDPVVIATGNDWRAIEAGAHAYASYTWTYKPLTVWERDKNGDLVGSIELPMAVGLVGGATKVHPTTKVAIKILGVSSARELAEVIAAVGLAQNLAALRALATEGIQRGHMSLHARNVAASAGATGELIDVVANKMVEEGKIRLDRAKEILKELSGE